VLASSLVVAVATSAAMAFGGMLLLFPPTRWLLKRLVLPKPGQGPSEEMQKSGFFKMKFWGRGRNAATDREEICTGSLEAMRGDPGYAQTSRFVAESAVACLSDEKGGFSGAIKSGVLTPSVVSFNILILPKNHMIWTKPKNCIYISTQAFGPRFREHLQNKLGLIYSVDSQANMK